MKSGGYRNLIFISQLAINVMVPTFLCLGLGLFLDKQFGTWFTVPLLFLGIAAGLRNVYVVAMSAVHDEEKARRKKEDEQIDRILNEHGVRTEEKK
ncbi:MAG: AtpZ/AtpI family protein [Lachnospiraceae bacterium]